MPKTVSAHCPYKYDSVSYSELSISNVVYPSWNDNNEPLNVIMSYAWAQEASLIAENDVERTNFNDPLARMMFPQSHTMWPSVSDVDNVTMPAALAQS